ncbi:MAG: ribonuclease III [Rhodospirillales bacterium]
MSEGPSGRLEKSLDHGFTRPELLKLALTHSSSNLHPDGRILTNERLEFLGDRVLGLLVARLLYDSFPGEQEGALSRRHTALVRREALTRVAEKIGLGGHIIMSASEEETGGRENPGLLADALEAVIAALFMDGGLEAADAFIRRYWEPIMKENQTPPTDAKTELQEWAQGQGMELPSYRETGREGPDHAPIFFVEVSVEGHPCVTSSGSSKRAAEQGAAKAMLGQIRMKKSGK